MTTHVRIPGTDYTYCERRCARPLGSSVSIVPIRAYEDATCVECRKWWNVETSAPAPIVREWGDLPGPRIAKPRKRPATGLTESYPLRHTPEQRKAWQSKADAAGMDLAAWIRARLDA